MNSALTSSTASKEPTRLLESLVRLTEKRDQHALEKCLVDTLPELIPSSSIVLYELQYIDDIIWVYPVAHSGNPGPDTPMQPLPGSDFAACLSCINSGTTSAELLADGHTRTYYPVEGIDGTYGCLSIEALSPSAETDRIVDAFLRIHSNYLLLIHDSERDTLTSLFNRKKFDARIIDAIEDTRHRGKRIKDVTTHHFLCLLDIDFFKKVNDTFGHLYGDEVLLIFARLMEETFRAEDWLFRFGGEEFLVILRNITDAQAFSALTRFRERIQAHEFPQVGHITVSIGFTRILANLLPTSIIEQADIALYYAKGHGRNQVQQYSELLAAGLIKPPASEAGSDIELF